jgi:uncharacterized protein
MEIPFESVAPEILEKIIEEFVTREGTDYGEEFELQEKIAQVRALILRGKATVVFDEISETCGIVAKDKT